MKLGTPFFILLMVIFVLTSVAFVINGFNVSYADSGVANSTLNEKYDFYDTVNSSFSKIADAASQVGSSEGWWDKLVSGTYVIILALVTTFTSLINSIPLFGTLLADMGTTFNIPDEIVSIGFVGIIGAIVIMIVKFYHRGS